MPLNPVPSQAAAVKARHTRTSSGTSSPAKKQPTVSSPPPRRIHYSVIIRLPFPRGDFIDPPQAEWDLGKDKKLWSIIANNAKIDNWEELANDFEVPLSFILQQAAWLYQRHMDSVREQMRKVGASNTPTPTPGSQPLTAGGVAMKRLGSGGASRAPSQLSIRSRDSPVPRTGDSGTGTPRPGVPGISRTSSNNTVTQSRAFLPPSSPRQPHQSSFRTANIAVPRKLDITNIPTAPEGDSKASSPAESSSSSSSEDENPLHKSNLFRRPNPRFQPHRKSALGTYISEDVSGSDDEESPTFLPSSKPTTGSSGRPDPGDTMRGVGKAQSRDPASYDSSPHNHPVDTDPSVSKGKGKAKPPNLSEASSTHSAGPAGGRFAHRADLARISPRKQSRHDGSDGTPSMGSSFSDLDGTNQRN